MNKVIGPILVIRVRLMFTWVALRVHTVSTVYYSRGLQNSRKSAELLNLCEALTRDRDGRDTKTLIKTLFIIRFFSIVHSVEKQKQKRNVSINWFKFSTQYIYGMGVSNVGFVLAGITFKKLQKQF